MEKNVKGLSDSKGEKVRICFLSKCSPARYKDLDYKILKDNFHVIRHDYSYTFLNIYQFYKKSQNCQIIFSWFANPYLAIFYPLLNHSSKLVVVAGGYDVASCPEIRYGARQNMFTAILTKFILEKAEAVLPVSQFNQQELLSFAKPQYQRLIYNAVNFPRFCLTNTHKRNKKIITIGAVSQNISVRKGHFRFIEIARKLPEYEFVLTGKSLDDTYGKLLEMAPKNVRLTGYLSKDDLLQELLSSSVYLQLSHHEAFGVSVAEAIACGCYPIVSRNTALPEITEGCGSVVDPENFDEIAEIVRKAVEKDYYLQINPELPASRFSATQREKDLIEVINDLFRN